jgi:hypothetical protein
MHVDDMTDTACLGRIWMIREVISRVWLIVGEVWHCEELVEMAKKVRISFSWLLDFSHFVRGTVIHATFVVPSSRGGANSRSTV